MCCRQLSGQAVPTWWRRATATSSTTCRPTRRCMRTSRVMTAIISTPAAPSSTFSTAPASAGAPVYLSAHLVWSLSKWHYFYSVNLQHLLLTRRSQHSQKCQKAQNPRRHCFCVSWPWPLTFWPENKWVFSFPGLMVEGTFLCQVWWF